MTTSVWSIFAYIWLYLVIVVISPNEIEIWEAVVTLVCFPILVVNSYVVEKYFSKAEDEEINDVEESQPLTNTGNLIKYQDKKISNNICMIYIKIGSYSVPEG